MILAIVRHGKAEAHSESGSDRDRRLRPRGERLARWLGEHLKQLSIVPELILSSPYERAITTARLVNQSFGSSLQTAAELECDEAVSRAAALIERYTGHQTLMVVGHNPQLSDLAGSLLQYGPRARVELSTGQAAVFETFQGADRGLAGRLVAEYRMPDED
jgi:phosphohistidine phosphatase